MAKLIDIKTAKSFVGIETNNYDSQINILLELLTGTIAKYIGLDNFDKETRTDIFYPTAGENKSIFILKKFPVDVSQPITIKIVDYDDTEFTIDSSLYNVLPDKGIIKFASPYVVYTTKLIKVSYTGGFEIDSLSDTYINIPAGLKFACLLWFSTIWNTKEHRGIVRISNDVRQSIQYTVDDIPNDVKEILNNYIRRVF